MPFWLQLVIPAAAGLVSALMGIALVPYLQKRRAFPPQAPKKEGDEAAEEERRPLLGGLLLLAGVLFASMRFNLKTLPFLLLFYGCRVHKGAVFMKNSLREASCSRTEVNCGFVVICKFNIQVF